jgi:hypothetical protein
LHQRLSISVIVDQDDPRQEKINPYDRHKTDL